MCQQMSQILCTDDVKLPYLNCKAILVIIQLFVCVEHKLGKCS